MFRQLTKLSLKGSIQKCQLLNPMITLSRGYNFLNVDVNKEKGVGVIAMNKPPVNSLTLEFLTELNMTLTELEDERSCRGVVLTSDVPNIFTAGLDITEMYNPGPERFPLFWKSLQDLWQTLYGSSLITIAAINGNSPAGGCLMALACDYRIMADGNFSMGLNETKLGVVAPVWLQNAMVNVVGQRQAELAIQLGKMYPSTEALRIKLVDKLVPVDQLREAALAEMDKWVAIPDLPRIISKTQLRGAMIEKFGQIRDEDLEYFIKFVNRPEVQKGLGRYVNKLKEKAQKKPS